MSKIKKYFKKAYSLVPHFLKGTWGILLIILIIIGYFILKPSLPIQYEYETITKTIFKQTVEGSGNVTTLKEVDLKSLSSGQITSVLVKPGQQVHRGQIIASLDSRSALIQVAQAKASYEKIINGSTSQQAQISKTNLNNAKATLQNVQKQQDIFVSNAKRILLNSSITALPITDSTVSNPIISGTYSCDTQGSYKVVLYTAGSGYYGTISGLENGTFEISQYGNSQPMGSCGLYIALDTSKKYNSGDQWEITLPNTLATNYVNNYNSYVSAVQTRDKSIADAQQNIDTAQASFNQEVATARPEDIASAQATLDSANLAYDNTFVRAPFDGQIGTVVVQTGDQVGNGADIATILTTSKIAEISLNEVDVAQVKIGQKVDLTFDAVSGLILPGTVSEIDTLGTENQNVITFKVKIAFDQDDQRIKPGMSVTGDVILQEKQDVLLVSNGTLKTENGKQYVEIADTNSTNLKKPNKQVFVETGLSNDTSTEIIGGLSIGDKVVVRIIPKSTTPKKTGLGGN